MDRSCSREGDQLIDLESGNNLVLNEESRSSYGEARKVLNKVWTGFVGIDGLVKGEDAVKFDNNNNNNSISSSLELPITNGKGLELDKRFEGEEKVGLLEKKAESEKPKKKSCKKPPRPPRRPKSPPLDDTDQKWIKELSELAVLRQARIERMKKKLKNTKPTSSTSNLCALIITILFCVVIIWQGFLSRGNSNVSFHGSPESSIQTRGRLISIQFHNNVSRNGPQVSSSASPSMLNAEPTSGIDDHTKPSRVG